VPFSLFWIIHPGAIAFFSFLRPHSVNNRNNERE
jgi:hypothetical protein